MMNKNIIAAMLLAAVVVLAGCTQAPSQNASATTPSGGGTPGTGTGTGYSGDTSTLTNALTAGSSGQTLDYDLISTQDNVASP